MYNVLPTSNLLLHVSVVGMKNGANKESIRSTGLCVCVCVVVCILHKPSCNFKFVKHVQSSQYVIIGASTLHYFLSFALLSSK